MCAQNPLHVRTHKLATEQQTMELDAVHSRDQNPLEGLNTIPAIPLEANTRAPGQQFPLMELLPELRIRIYECVFADLANSLTPWSLSTIQNLDDHMRPRLQDFLALLHASRALRSEALEAYCLTAKARLASLRKAIQSMYAAIHVLGKMPNWTALVEAHARKLVIGKLGIFLRVIKFAMDDGGEKRGWSFAALKVSMEVHDADGMGCD